MTKLFALLSMAFISASFASSHSDHFEVTAGIGAEIQILQDGTFSILADLPDSPAEAAGLQIGDQIEAVASNSVTGKTLEEVVQMIRGPVGTTVEIEILRDSQEIVVALVREPLPSY